VTRAPGSTYAELERQLDVEGRQLLRQLLQDHVDLGAMRKKRIDVLDADGARRSRVETGHTRGLPPIFGDGNVHQIQRIQAEANARGVPVAIVVDFVHVLEYLWRAAWSFHPEGDPAAEAWVRKHAQTILDGHATRVAGTLRRAATIAGLNPADAKTQTSAPAT